MSLSSEEVRFRSNLTRIANTVNNQLQSKLTLPELKQLVQFVRHQQNKRWPNMSQGQICDAIAAAYVTKLNDGDSTVVDMHEILKSHIGTIADEPNPDDFNNVNEYGVPLSQTVSTVDVVVEQPPKPIVVSAITSFMGKTDDTALRTLINPSSTFRKNYILLDSRYRDTSQDVSGFSTIKWNFLANTPTASDGGVNSVGDVQNIVAFSTGDIRLPYQDNMMVNAYRRVSLLVNEWSGQAYIGQEGRKFHLMYRSNVDNNMIDCSAITDGQTIFEFAKPITQIDTITISFGCPLEPVTFDIDRLHMTIAYTNPVSFTNATPHKLQTGDQVYVIGFTTADPAADALAILNINTPAGHNCVVTSATTIELPDLDFSTLVAPITPLNVLIYFGSKRIFIPLELTYMAK